jgi:hypothetical protein
LTDQRQRRRQARVIETLRADVDEHFPQSGPCGLCGDTVLGQRHRIIDTIAELVRAGEGIEDVMADYRVSIRGVAVALAVSW